MAKVEKPAIENFSRASGTIFRGSVPNVDGLRFLRSIGVKTVIDLRHAGFQTEQESRTAVGCGLNYFNLQSGYLDVPDSVVAAFVAVSLHPSYGPIYLHCSDGGDRTGALIGIYRVTVEGWPFDWAYAEMTARKFKPWQIFLRRSVRRFAESMTSLNTQQRLWALQEMVQTNIFSR